MSTDTNAEPAVTVVIATHNRAALLTETLDGLQQQTRSDVEIIVVDDDSTDETPAVLEALGVRALRVPRGGPAVARQQAWPLARGRVVAFTDDDCVPSPKWIEALVAPIESGKADIVQGRTLPRPDQLDRMGPWSRTQEVTHESGFYQTCNIAYRKDVLEQLGGFHPDFSGPRTSGEDAELAWRAKKSGYRIAFADEALVHHVVWPSSYCAHLRDRPRWGMLVQVVRLHPETRQLAYKGYFFRPSHLRLLVLLAVLTGATAVRRWLGPALVAGGAAGYVLKSRGDPEPAGQRLRLLGEVLLADAVEVAVFTRASVRYRTLLL